MTVYWLSFADPQRPKGERFLGAAVVEADTFAEAIKRSWSHGCNPGGEIQGTPLPARETMSDRQLELLAATPFHTLLSKDEIVGLGIVRPDQIGE